MDDENDDEMDKPDPDGVTAEHASSGLRVSLYRSRMDGEMVIDIDTSGLEGDDNLDGGGEPRVRIYLNDARVFDHGEPVDGNDWSS